MFLDAIMDTSRKAWKPLELPDGPITRGRSKLLKDAVQGLVMGYQKESFLMKSRMEGIGMHKNQLGKHWSLLKVKENETDEIRRS